MERHDDRVTAVLRRWKDVLRPLLWATTVEKFVSMYL